MTKEESNTLEEKVHSEQSVREKSSRQRTQKRDKTKPLTKIVIRHLPPTMTEEDFLKQIDPLPDHDFYYYANADWSLGSDATCRAYINLKNYDDLFLFRDRFDGYIFVDSKGQEYPAIVEFAPFQGLSKNRSRKTDPKVNTIEQEQDYISFIEKLEEEREAAARGAVELMEFSLDHKREEKVTSTPLLQYLANKKEKRREENKRRNEEKRRQREEEKERRSQNQQQQPITKIVSGQEEGNKKDGGGNKTGDGKENSGNKNDHATGDEFKSTRSKRRAARDQRRREEHEQRKRDRLEREQREKLGMIPEEENEGPNNDKNSSCKRENSNKSNDRKAENTGRKDVKKYSERRERDRKRNRKEQELDHASAKDDEAASSSNVATTEPGSTANTKEEEVSDSVKDFIRCVASVNEFVPRSMTMENEREEAEVLEASQIAESNQPEIKAKAKTIEEDLAKVAQSKTAEQKAGKEVTKNTVMDTSVALEERQLQKQRVLEERRIRNKDRPSIAIYQPKARLRLSEESDSKDATVKDPRSNPNSDCEGIKREESHQRPKKPARYSERRSERRSRDKRREESASESVVSSQREPSLKESRTRTESGCDISEKIEVAQEVN